MAHPTDVPGSWRRPAPSGRVARSRRFDPSDRVTPARAADPSRVPAPSCRPARPAPAREPEVPHAEARAVLKARFGFDAFRPGQERLIAGVLAGRDTLGVLPTGGGKTLCYQLPAFMLDGLVLVVSPLISLMQDQVDRARRLGLRAASLTSQDAASAQARTRRDLARQRLDLLFCSPERLEAASLRKVLSTIRVGLLTIDEAHCISEWGHEFRPAFRRVLGIREVVRSPVLAVTATATPAVRDDIVQVLGMRDPVRVVTSFDRPNIRWLVQSSPSGAARIRAMARHIRRAPPECADRALIVYAPTRRQVVGVRRALASHGVVGDAYHAALQKNERQAVQQRFMSGSSNVVVATCAFGMGIDRGDVWAVFHYAFPGSLESYYQEAGRAGRDGEPSMALGFVDKADWKVPQAFLERAYPEPRQVLRFLKTLAGARAHGHNLAHGHNFADRRSPTHRCTLDPYALIGHGAGNVPHLKWLLRSGAIEIDPVLASWIETWPDGEEDGPPATAGELLVLTGKPPDLSPLVAARRQALDRLNAMRKYSGRSGCRRKQLLRYLGETVEWRSCSSCDRCERRTGPRPWRLWRR